MRSIGFWLLGMTIVGMIFVPSRTACFGYLENGSSDIWSDCVSDDCMMIHPLKIAYCITPNVG